MSRRTFRQNRSGQVIIVTALVLALLLLSTAIYVIQTVKYVPKASYSDPFPAYQQGIRNTLISALANVTSGGNPSILSLDLNQLNNAFESNSFEILQISYTPLNAAPYQSGFWINWGANGQGVSSVYVSYDFNSTDLVSSKNLQLAVNITSQVSLTGKYLQTDNATKQVYLTINLFNEQAPTLAQSFTFYYENQASWVSVGSPRITGYGNGTYTASFAAQTNQIGEPLPVSVLSQDQRGILIGANMTCTST